MKRVKIFLASSITDLRFDRVEIGNFFRQMNDIYIESGVYFDLVMCEDYDNTIAFDGKQSQFDKEICGSELVFFLFFKKVGDYTKHEFEVALEHYKSVGKPKILTYFKYVDSPDNAENDVLAFMQLLDKEVKHYYNVYNCIDTLKLGIFMQIKMMRLDESEIKLENGKLLVGSREVADTSSIPLFSGNERLSEIRRELEESKKEYISLKAVLLEDGSDDAYIRFGAIAAKKAELEKECARLENAILTTAESIAKETSCESELSEKQRTAYRFMQRGLWKEALEILNADEILSELSHNESLAERMLSRIETNVSELLQRIEVLCSVGLNPESIKEVYDLYARVYETSIRYNLSKKPILAYARFLNEQNDIDKCLGIAQKLSFLFSDPDAEISVRERAELSHYMGHFFINAKRYDEAEETLRRAIGLYEGMPDLTDKDRLELARAYNGLANTFFYRHKYQPLVENYQKAKEIFESLYTRHADENDFAGGYAMALDNCGIGLEKIHDYEGAVASHLEALKIYSALAEKDPVAYRLRYARCCHNSACSYEFIPNYERSEYYFKEAIRVREEERLQNPHAVEPLLSGTYWCLGNLYSSLTDEPERAIEPYETAYSMRLGMRRRSPVYASEFYTIFSALYRLYDRENDNIHAAAICRRYIRDLLTLGPAGDEAENIENALRRIFWALTEMEGTGELEQEAQAAIDIYHEILDAKIGGYAASPLCYKELCDAFEQLGLEKQAKMLRKPE